jgi:selenocysteine lyase/cysteine desulfurase
MIDDPRALFAVPAPGPYLLSHSAGCLPHASRARLNADLLDPWAEAGSDAWGKWLAAIDGFRAGVAGLIGGDMAEICPQPSVSAALTAILSGLQREPGRDTLLASAHAFATVGFAMRQLAPLGFKLELIPEDRDPVDPQSWADAIGPHVAAIVPMHVHSNSGLVSPMREIARLARAAGAISVGDVCQAIGIIPVEPHAWGVDALVGSSLKWLCGGPGAGFLWMRRDLIGAFAPVNAGWFSHADPFEFDIRDFRYADDARRFWGGTPTVAPYVLAASGIDTVKAIGLPAILKTNRALIATMAQAADSVFDMSDRGGTLCLTGEDVDAAELALRMLDARFDRRGRILRLSFHVWNDMDQARSLGDAVRKHRLRLIG